MTRIVDSSISRRAMMIGTTATALTAAAGLPLRFPAARQSEFKLVAAPAQVRLGLPDGTRTNVWAFNGTVPGPTLRVRQGDRVRIVVENRIPQGTSVHWHGVRVPNAMDGAPPTTQPPIPSGDTFVYEFDAHDAGTYWYHPHLRSFEQVDRGLAGALIVEERDPIAVDRDVIWVLDDWRLLPSGAISNDFLNFMDASHNGRVGNWVTINGTSPDTFGAKPAERIRLRLINAANARIFALEFAGHEPKIVAIDGQPVEPHAPDGGRVVLAPGMRVDLVLDMKGRAGQRFTVKDSFYRGQEYNLVDIAYAGAAVRDRPLDRPIALPPNPLSEPDLKTAARHEVVLSGGMMGNMTGGGMGGMMGGGGMGMGRMTQNGAAWTINGVAALEHLHDPMLTIERDRSCILAMVNDTAWHHPMHLHGHTFRVLSRNGRPTRYREWQDTVLMAPGERVEIAFVADNPGDWMFHCHILEHQAAGMDALIRVADAKAPDATSDPHGSAH